MQALQPSQELSNYYTFARLVSADAELYFSGGNLLASNERKEILLADLNLMTAEIERLRQLISKKNEG
jgi:hypothetical protein